MQGRIIDSLEEATALFAPAFARARSERLRIAHLDDRDALIGLRMRFGADAPRIPFPLRTIIGDALRLRSVSIILAHNHPSGDPAPTIADVVATRDLVQVARPLGIAVRDHLIFGGGAVVSFRQRGLL